MNRVVGFLNGISLPLVIAMGVTIGREAYDDRSLNAFLVLMPLCLCCGWTSPLLVISILSIYMGWYTLYFLLGYVHREVAVIYPLFGGLIAATFAMEVRGMYDYFRGRYG